MIDGNCHVTISDSLITLTLLSGSSSDLSFVDSTVRMLFAHEASATFRFANSRIREDLMLTDSFLWFGAGADVAEGTEIGAWIDTSIFRTFEITIEDEDGIPLTGVEVQISNPSGVRLSQVITDEKAQATASILFTSQTWHKAFTLTLPELGVSKSLGFFGESAFAIVVSE